MRNFLYQLARLIGDFNAIRKGRIVQRVERRTLGRFAGKIIGRIVK